MRHVTIDTLLMFCENKRDVVACEQQRRRSVCVSVQSDHRLYYSLYLKYVVIRVHVQANLCN